MLQFTGIFWKRLPLFKSFDITYNAVRKNALSSRKRSCLETTGYQPIEVEDMAKLDVYFDRSTPKRLQHEVFFLILYHFGFRGREWIRNLTKETVKICTGPDGKKYATLIKEEQEKNVKANDYRNLRQEAIYETEDKSKCPLAAIEEYMSRLPSENLALFPKVKAKWDQNNYYCQKEVVGKNMLHELMKTISKEAGLSKLYTNHCPRVSLVTWLKEKEFSNDEIKAVTSKYLKFDNIFNRK